MNYLPSVEKIANKRFLKIIPTLAEKIGIRVIISKKSTTSSNETDVYGHHARKAPEYDEGFKVKNVIIVGENLSPISLFQIGTLQEGIVYEINDDIEVGDLLTVERPGNAKRQFQVIELESHGNTTEVLKRLRISSIQGDS
jgi:hypothetical protein